MSPGDPDYFCQWCYDKGLRCQGEGPWKHAIECPNNQKQAHDRNEKLAAILSGDRTRRNISVRRWKRSSGVH